MINLRAIFVISVLISGLIFSPSYSFAQGNQNDNPLASLFEMFMQIFSFGDDDSELVMEFGDAVIVQSSGSSSTSDTSDNNIPPTADAGDNQTVMEFDKVTLDSSSSTDSDGTIMSFKWTQVFGTSVTLSSMTHPSPMFNAPNVDTQDPLQNILTFMLAVVDNSSGTGSDKVNITVNKKDEPEDPQREDPEPADPEPPGNENGGNKVTICHAPPGNPNNAHTITVGTYAAQAHLIHHDEDTLGACGGNGVNENKKSNTGKGNNNDDDDDRKGNSGKGNQNIKDDNRNKSNSGKDKDDNANKSNSGKDKDDNANKSNSGKDKDDNANKSNSKLNNNDD